jgi:hypothetical protein
VRQTAEHEEAHMEDTDTQPRLDDSAALSQRWFAFRTGLRRAHPSIRLLEPTGPLGQYWVVVLYAWLAVVITAAPHVPVPLRVLVVFTFVFVGPGIPIIGLLRHSRPLEHFVLALMVSMSLATVLAEGMALVGRLTGLAGLAALAGITTVAAVLEGSQERASQARLEPQRPDAAQLDNAESIS